MNKTDVNRVHRILDPLKPIAGPNIATRPTHSIVPVELGNFWQLRRLALPHIGENQSSIVNCRIVKNPNLGRETRIFGWHFYTSAITIIFPSMISTSNTVPFNPTSVKQC
jgi:hypothetical protein